MRTLNLSRAVIASAALAVSATALTATTATAATPSGITRESVLTAAAGYRANPDNPGGPAIKAVRSILHRGCAVDIDGGELLDTTVEAIPAKAGGSADGLVAYGQIFNIVDESQRDCVVAVVASTLPDFTLSGTSTVSVQTDPGNKTVSVTTPLTGDVTVSAPITVVPPATFTGGFPAFSATGAITKTTNVPAVKVKDKKTTSEKKAAKKKYDKRIKAAKKSYKKALAKAKSSKSKKAAAKKAYVAKRATAKAKYSYAIAGYRIVKKATTSTDSRPFALSLELL
ncbi:hypothetical protein [Aeromicrobium fastidiosum]|uniref:Uncharacterized protein n=1 Tax=Aeromicrobium fastidiosum TaxID=52699 RepID=A0A641AQQ1_9ACTN|nr:hypothetical protein [Aeromicrobium fastidiosum]KAA1380434.1 hypothetical protein ESP62_004430 [Aeromicrobium fastidiosum]MBP2390012.1 hypothetical protein [Aeromicrobium fastidiosum]